MEPALSRESAERLPISLPAKPGKAPGVVEPGLNGLVEGVGRDVFEIKYDCGFKAPKPAAGEKRDGSVPALVLPLAVAAEAVLFASEMGCVKSGNPSALGDSGMVSRSGVLLPLVGGPQAWSPPKPSCA